MPFALLSRNTLFNNNDVKPYATREENKQLKRLMIHFNHSSRLSIFCSRFQSFHLNLYHSQVKILLWFKYYLCTFTHIRERDIIFNNYFYMIYVLYYITILLYI